jgi:hypothetical protein
MFIDQHRHPTRGIHPRAIPERQSLLSVNSNRCFGSYEGDGNPSRGIQTWPS